MDLTRKNKTLAFILALVLILTVPTLYPKARLLFFAPYLIIIYYQLAFVQALWWSFACGLIVDVLSSNSFIGLNAFCYCLATGFLYRQRIHFFADRISTLPLMTYLFAVISTLICLFLEYVIQKKPVISPGWVVTDLFAMPLFDSFYAFALFVLPFLILGKPRRRGRDYFLR